MRLNFVFYLFQLLESNYAVFTFQKISLKGHFVLQRGKVKVIYLKVEIHLTK